MKRATTLKVLAGTLVLTLVASAFPLAEVALNATTDAAGTEGRMARDGEGSPSTGLPPLPFMPPNDGSAPSGASGAAGSLDGSSSRPGASYASRDRASASGSVLLSQVLGAAESLGYQVEIPPLPTDLIATDAPLRAAILAWIAATGAVVPPEELVTQLARADTLPLAVQRDVALLLLSTMEAASLQRAALSRIDPVDLKWIYANPEVAQQLVQGIDTPDTRRMAFLAGAVDMPQSIAATLLVLQAIEATRGSLSDPQAAEALELTASLDDATRAVLEVLARGDAATSDVEKVRLAAKLVAIGGGIDVPAPRAAPTFAAALQRLLDASGMAPAPALLADVLARADALPDDLQGAIARLIEAEAIAIEAASPLHLTPTSQHEALAATLVATAEALPVLEKYHLYWRQAPEALRVSEWDPAARAGWATHHIALVVSAQNDLVGLVQAAELVNGRDVPSVPAVPALSFVEAYEAAARAGGFSVSAAERAEVVRAGESLPSQVRDAATTLLSGAAESARLREEAFAALSPAEQEFLALRVDGLDALYTSPSLSTEQLATLARAVALAELVDARKLAQANAVAALAMTEAQRMLQTGGSFSTQGDATVIPSGLAGLFARLNPLGSARAQDATACSSIFGLIEIQCDNDVLLRIRYPEIPVSGYTPAEGRAFQSMVNNSFMLPARSAYTCDDRECVVYYDGRDSFPNGGAYQDGEGNRLDIGGQANRDLLVITGQASSTYQPEFAVRNICASYTPQAGPTEWTWPCRQEMVPRYGAPTISIDLGGDDTYVEARAMVAINATLPVSFHLDMGGNDVHVDPTSLYDARSPLLSALGSNAGHPSQASAIFGGAAILVDVNGNDIYEAASRSQGFGRLGVGLLADLAGNDIFTAGSASQAASGETFTLGAGILFNANGNDDYVAESGQGFGLGSIFLDVGGDDRYVNEHAASGIPVLALDVLPGGNVTAFDRRDDNVAWLDGPGSINLGIAVDQEVVLTSGQSDRDNIPDVVEFAFGTDPYNAQDSPVTNPTARATAIVDDADQDGYPGYIERALSTDPNDPASYPVGLPAGIPIRIPQAVMPVLTTGRANEILGIEGNGSVSTLDDLGGTPVEGSMEGGDKIVDLRLPIQDAGSITYACTGTFYANQTSPVGAVSEGGFTGFNSATFLSETTAPGENFFTALPLGGILGEQNEDTNGPDAQDGETYERCLYASYQSSGGGQGNGTLPDEGGADGDDFTFQFPAGILAIGDLVATKYVDDYFVVIDLGGNDFFNNSAGGAIPVRLTPRPESQPTQESDANMGRVNQTFFAPSLVVNVDVGASTQSAVTSGIGADVYANDSRDFTQGAFFGLLIDTSGPDRYTARDGSQGALGGVLLDLGGTDAYKARHLSQGAALAHQVPAGSNIRPHPELPGPGNVDSVNPGTGSPQQLTARRALPGILLDAGELPLANSFTAASHSQGFGRGFSAPAPNNNTAPAIGILASVSGANAGGSGDSYTAEGRFSQGVGGNDGVGVLFDLSGRDAYSAVGLISQGATISQSVATGEAKEGQQPHPATGVLVDLNGDDDYRYSIRGLPQGRDERNMNTTITRAETTASAVRPARLYTDTGVHIDWIADPAQPGAFLASVGGSGEGAAFSDDPNEGFVVNLPTARLAIGGKAATLYEHEYAFVVDLGGANEYRMSAAGLVREELASFDADPRVHAAAASNTYSTPVSAFPVSVLVEAGAGDSRYVSDTGFSQGAGFFGVGILADLGGRDTFVALPEPNLGTASDWMETAPVIDGSIGSDWDGITAQPIVLASQNDTRFDSPWTMRIANDNRTLYMALSGFTSSTEPTDRLRDNLTVHFDMARQNEAWDWTNDRTGIDSVLLSFDEDGQCIASDRTAALTGTGASTIHTSYAADAARNSDWAKLDTVPRFQAACRTTETGEVIFEIRKDLVIREPLDKHDLSYCYEDGVGFGRAVADERECVFPANELGVYIEFADTGAGYYMQAGGGNQPARQLPRPFTWPAGSVQYDGHLGHLRDSDLTDEMSRWGPIGLAVEGEKGAAPVVGRPPSLSHGAGVAGVGVLAMLGSAANADITAGDRAMGYGSLEGLGVLIDLGGSDRYQGRDLVLGASEGTGAGVLVELSGNENYLTRDNSVGFTPAGALAPGGAIFLDLGGEDDYVWEPHFTAQFDQARGALTTSNASFVPLREGNNMGWVQNAGVGLDYRLSSLIGEIATDTLANVLFGGTRTTLTLSAITIKNGVETCSDNALPKQPGTDKAIVTGKACLRATVDVGRGVLRGTSGFDAVRGFANENAEAKAALEKAEKDLHEQGVSADINVSSVDFFMDRARIGTAHRESRRYLDDGSQVWEHIIDLASSTDGVARIKAMPVFTTTLPSGEMLVFQEGNDLTNAVADAASHKTVYINNPPAVDISVLPAYTGTANATYSPYAFGSVHSLNTTWAVSPDAGESRLALFNGWEPHPSNTSIPCKGIPSETERPSLCHLLPFYLTTSGELTTTPGAAIENDPRNIKTEALDSVQPYSGSTARTQTDLAIMRNQSFHLTIPNRVAIPSITDYTTEIRIKLVDDESNQPVEDADGKTWFLGYAKKTRPAQLDVPLADLPIPVDDIPALLKKVDDTLTQISEQNVVWDQVNSTYSTVCRNDRSDPCNLTVGRYGTGQIRFCKANPPGVPSGSIGWQLHGLIAKLDKTAYETRATDELPAPLTGARLCDGAFDHLNDSAAYAGGGIPALASGALENASTAFNTAVGLAEQADLIPEGESGEPGGPAEPGGPSQLHFKDFYFDVNTTPPGDYWLTRANGAIGWQNDRIVIPPGFKLELEFGLVSGEGARSPGDPYRTLVGYVDENVSAQWPYGEHPITDSVYENNVDFTLNQQQGRAGLGTTLDNLAKGGYVPSSFFVVKAGDPLEQPRLEVRVPADATTTVDVTLTRAGQQDPSATVVGDLPVVGDRNTTLSPTQTSGDGSAEWLAVDGDEHVSWFRDSDDAYGRRWTEYNASFRDESIDDGLYVLTVTARDEAQQTTATTERVILDKTAPRTFVTSAEVAGSSLITAGTIPVRWFADEPASGIREVFLYAREGTEGDLTQGWERYPQENGAQSPAGYPATQTSMRYSVSAAHTTYLFMTVGVDRANNVEGTLNAQTRDEALLSAFAAKLAAGEGRGYTKVFLDRSNPRFLSVGTVGGQLLDYQGSDFTFLKAGEPVEFRVCVRDAESGIFGVNLELFPVDPAHVSKANVSPMQASGACGTNGRLYTHTTWGDVNQNAALYPEGIWRVQMQVFDLGGNTIRVGGGAVVLDHASPTVTVDDPVLPPGQTAVKPGDLVKVRLLATDAWGVDEGAIAVDASAFALNATSLAVRPVRVNGIIYQEASFTVDKPDIENGVFEIRVSVPDLAGNTTTIVKHLAVNFRPFEFVPGSLRVTNVTHNSLELRWKTDEPTSALAKFGTSAVALSGRTPQVINATKDHVLKVEGLSPSTSYYLRAVSVSTGGFTKESDIIEAQTTTALFLRAIAPTANDAVSGNVPVRFAGGLLDSEAFVTYTLEVRADADKPWTFVTTATRQGDEHTLLWNSTRFLDGTAYELRLTAEAGKDVASLTIGPLTSDNTPASILVLAPLMATNDTTPAFEAEAADDLSGLVDLVGSITNRTRGETTYANVRLLVDGKPLLAPFDIRLDDGRLRIKHAGLTGIEPGLRTFELQVSDVAGNVAKETWKVAIDGEAPEIKVNPTRFAPGTAAARNGGSVTLNLTIKDLSGVASVVANTSGIATAAQTKLVKLVGTDNWQGTFSVSDASPFAEYAIAIRAVDLAGNANVTTVVPIELDNVEPRIALTRAEDATYTSAVIVVPSENEPVLVTATATAPGSPVVTASTTQAAQTARLELKGLLPSRTYRVAIVATDLAGNPVNLALSFPTLDDNEAPGGVGALSVVDLLNGTLRLQWSAATDNVGVASYRVYRSADDGATFQLIAEVAGPTFEDRGLPYEKAYVYRVAAFDHGANEGPSSDPLRTAATAVPRLSAGLATPTVGTTATVFRYTVTYVSPGGRAAEYVRVIIDGVPQNMTLGSGDALTGALYVYETRLAPHKRDAPHTYAYESSDGRYTAKFPEDGSVLRGPLVSGSELSEEEVGRLAAFAQRVPLGGAAGVAIAMIAAIAIAAVLRKKKEGSK